MDNTGNNRYELLFLDDDISAPTTGQVENTSTKKKSKVAVVPLTAHKKLNSTNEKENKACALNKNESSRKTIRSNDQSGKTKTGNHPSTGENQKVVSIAPGKGNTGIQNGGESAARDQRRSIVSATSGGEHKDTRTNRQIRDSRGPPRQRNGERFGKREYDRQSGSDKTGVKSIDKRDGAGAHNWGSAKQDIEDINKNGGDLVLPDKYELANEQSPDQNQVIALDEEEEAKEMTLDEWKALNGQRVKPKYNIRKAGEGVDNSEWKKMVVLNKKKENDGEDEFEYDPSMYPQRVGRVQRIVDIEFNFNDGRRSGFRNRNRTTGNAGGAARPGGGYERGSHRNFGDRQRTGGNALKVDDERQFPTLG